MIGNDAYIKTTAAYNTGVNDKGWSSSFLLTKWSGDGYINHTKGEGWTYFAAVGYTPEGSRSKYNLLLLELVNGTTNVICGYRFAITKTLVNQELTEDGTLTVVHLTAKSLV